MKKIKLSLLAILAGLLGVEAQQSATIEAIKSNPGLYHHVEVQFKGFVQYYVHEQGINTSYYKIQGEYGDRIRVNTSQPAPQIYACYTVIGIVTVENQEPLIIEKSRRLCDTGNGPLLTVNINPPGGGFTSHSGFIKVSAGETIQINASANRGYKFLNWSLNNVVVSSNETIILTVPDGSSTLTANFEESGFDMMIIIIIALVVIAGLIIFFLNRPKPAPPIVDQPSTPISSSLPTEGDSVRIREDDEWITVKFEPVVPSTMKFIPGKLEIINGPDKGKSFMLAGYPTPDGSISSIGRDHEGWDKSLSGGRKYAHIRIKDDSRTLSRMQAEIVYRSGKVYLKNLSSVNSSQVDGYDVPVNEVVEVKSGSVIKAGFIEFRYQA